MRTMSQPYELDLDAVRGLLAKEVTVQYPGVIDNYQNKTLLLYLFVFRSSCGVSITSNESYSELLHPYSQQIETLRRIGHKLWSRGWSVGTSSNYSVVINTNPWRLLITASGKDKGHLGPNDFVIVDEDGKLVPSGQSKSSAETLLHCSALNTNLPVPFCTPTAFGAPCFRITSPNWAELSSMVLKC